MKSDHDHHCQHCRHHHIIIITTTMTITIILIITTMTTTIPIIKANALSELTLY